MAKMYRSKAPFLWMTVLVLLIIVVPQPQPVASQFRPSQPEVGCYASENTGVLTGIVTSSDTQQPINKVLVRLYRPYNRNTEFSSLNYALTDDTGRYTLPAVKQDLYRISFSNSPLYAKEWYSDTASQFAAPAVLIRAGITTTIDAKLELGGTITGHITDKDTGSPLANVSVTAFSDGGPMGGYAIERTDATGQYSLTHLHTGSYVIGAQSISYYNDAINYAEANPVTIASGGVISNINFSLPRATALIYGEVRDFSTGEKPEFLQVLVNAVRTSADGQIAGQILQGNFSSGTYSITVPPGLYKVFLSPQQNASYPDYAGVYAVGKSSFTEAEIIDVTNSSAQVRRDISLTVSGGFTVTVLDALTQQPLSMLDDFYVTSVDPQQAALFPEKNFGPGTGWPLFAGGQAPRFRLRTDTYAVTLSAPGYASKTVNVQVHAPDQVDAGTVMLTPCSQLPPSPDPNTLINKIHLPALRRPSPSTLNLSSQ